MRQSRTISLPEGQYHSLRSKEYHSHIKQRRERASRNFVSALLSLLFLSPVSYLFNKCLRLCPYPYFISPIRTSPNSAVFFCAKIAAASRKRRPQTSRNKAWSDDFRSGLEMSKEAVCFCAKWRLSPFSHPFFTPVFTIFTLFSPRKIGFSPLGGVPHIKILC